jgi:diguanylate cyclase (GGDEF)-like protein
MRDRRRESRNRTLLSGKIVFNDKRSVIDCIVRNLSDGGACLQVNNTFGLPSDFALVIDGDRDTRPCHVAWQSETRVGIVFRQAQIGDDPEDISTVEAPSLVPAALLSSTEGRGSSDLIRGELLAVRAALDQVPIGIVLLDADTRAQFINRAFRRMWRLPDAKADSKPPFVALMYHGRDTKAYAVSADKLDAYVAQRVAHVKSGNPGPVDLRLASSEVIRLQCTVLPSGGRMLCYTYVTDIVRHSDKLEMLRGALDQMEQGICLLDEFMNTQFMNRAVRRLWHVSDEQADRKPPYVELVSDARKTGTFGVPPDELNRFISNRIALVRAGDPTPMDIPHGDGRTIRSQCAVLPNGGRMVTYTDVTDLVRRANQFEQLATIDGLTGLGNRRQFDTLAEAEWQRFQRCHRPLSLMLVDLDHFKQINDQYGHEAGDQAIKELAAIFAESKRGTDIVARLGGDEFAMLLPETDLEQALAAAERLRGAVIGRNRRSGDHSTAITLSIGVATATLSMSGIKALMRKADGALYEAKEAGRNCTRATSESEARLYSHAAE